MSGLLRGLMAALGAAAIAICLSIFVLGAGATALTAERIFDAASGARGFSEAWPPSMDSELRFYAPFWGAYGVLLLMTARDFERRSALVPWLAAVFFAGGVGRAISWTALGAPHPFFIFLMATELATPPAMVGLWLAARRR